MDSCSRRDFVQVAGLGAAGALGAGGCCSVRPGIWGQLPENELELQIDGVDREFYFLHVTGAGSEGRYRFVRVRGTVGKA